MARVLYLTGESIRFDEPMTRGGAIHVRNVVAGLRGRGHEVALVDWNRNPDRQFQHSVVPRSRFVDGPLRTVRRAMSVGREMDVDVLVSKTRKTYLPGLLAARRLGVPHVVHVGSSLGARPGLTNRVSTSSFSLRLRAPHDGYFVVCESIAAELAHRGVSQHQIFNVRNAVDTERFSPAPDDTEAVDAIRATHEASVGSSETTLGYIGGLHDYKGLFDLAAAVKHCTSNVSVLLAGDGPARESLEGAFGDTATFLGLVPYDDVPAVYHAMDAFVLPSHTEGLPRVVLEAHATGTPVVATRVGGVPEVVEDGEMGLLCQPRDPSSLASAIDRLTAEPSERDRMAERAREAVEHGYAWEALYDRYEEFLTRVLDGEEGR